MNFLPSSSIVSVCRSKRSRGPPPASKAPSFVTWPTISTSLTFTNSGGGVAKRGGGVAMRAKAPAHTSANKAAACAARRLLIAPAATVQKTRAADAHPQSPADCCQCVDNQIPLRMLRRREQEGRDVGLSLEGA